MHEHDEGCVASVDKAHCRVQSNVAIMRTLSDSLKWVSGDYISYHVVLAMRRRSSSSKKVQYLPAEEYPYLLLRFHDTYTYYYIHTIF